MRRRRIVVMGSVILVLCAIVTGIVTRAVNPPSDDEELRLVPASVWGADQAFCWSFPPPPHACFDSRHILELAFRETEEPLPPPGESVVLHAMQAAAVPFANAKREFAAGGAVLATAAPSSQPRTAQVQLLDLRDIGAASTRAGQTLRVLGKIRFGGTSCGLSADDVILPAGTFAGTGWQQSGHWMNGELYLMSFYVRGATAVFKYDALLKVEQVQ